MPHHALIKPTHKSITTYYATLKDLAAQTVSHEMGLRRAFQELLAQTARLHDWTLIPEGTSSRELSPDGTPSPPNSAAALLRRVIHYRGQELEL